MHTNYDVGLCSYSKYHCIYSFIITGIYFILCFIGNIANILMESIH